MTSLCKPCMRWCLWGRIRALATTQQSLRRTRWRSSRAIVPQAATDFFQHCARQARWRAHDDRAARHPLVFRLSTSCSCAGKRGLCGMVLDWRGNADLYDCGGNSFDWKAFPQPTGACLKRPFGAADFSRIWAGCGLTVNEFFPPDNIENAEQRQKRHRQLYPDQRKGPSAGMQQRSG